MFECNSIFEKPITPTVHSQNKSFTSLYNQAICIFKKNYVVLDLNLTHQVAFHKF